ncbi:MAG: hypothetical protein A3B25_03230 [Candidatus Ryanbacteria bacterium RIFCSPLOWO2_01_FULL_48_26]|uniref:Uncharacterized protein n=1 Tax=Candidatus Ryanbacteria bacterium RIFCSPLOWO2_01_FULL_48_26 TaxID=1802126 RepID=A0A1G2GSE5_9BACT|nr:MAG: hypothetical protein A3B25_03230 [Candidatus Ryanbacteria bacterium RIFCSPLOWO2_01_FULL_48_26]OHB20883.1 MAG: hypothetical protein A3J67_03575 [Parcubacteria group bacterium RIFCSPHIGHO2_02_FULL_48_10b]
MILIMKKFWNWLGEEKNHNALTIILAFIAVVFAFPFFSKQINNIQVKIDSIEQSIKNLYQRYALETFCPSDLKNSYKPENGQYIVQLNLKNKPVHNSVSIWEGAFVISPSYFTVEGNKISLETNFGPNDIDQGCDHSSFQYTVTYVRDF